MELEHAFGWTLRRNRRLRDLSQEQLAEQAELSVSYISLMERGKRAPTVATLIKLAKPLHVPANKLLQQTLKRMQHNP